MSLTSNDDNEITLPSPPFYQVPNLNNLRDAAYALTTGTGTRLRQNLLFRSAEVSKLTSPSWLLLRSLGITQVFDLRSEPEVLRGWAGMMAQERGAEGEVSANGPERWIAGMQGAGIQRAWVPVFKTEDYSPERLAERYVKYMDESVMGFVGAYREILKDGGPAYGVILRYLAGLNFESNGREDKEQQQNEQRQSNGGGSGSGSGGALIHCTAGKDRTGIFFGILFDFLGVPRSQIADEYNLTELGLRHVRDDVVQRVMQSPGFKQYIQAQLDGRTLTAEEVAKGMRTRTADEPAAAAGTTTTTTTTTVPNQTGDNTKDTPLPPSVLEKAQQAALRMISARKEAMHQSLKMVDREFGGAENYLREYCKLEDEELDKLRRNLLVVEEEEEEGEKKKKKEEEEEEEEEA